MTNDAYDEGYACRRGDCHAGATSSIDPPSRDQKHNKRASASKTTRYGGGVRPVRTLDYVRLLYAVEVEANMALSATAPNVSPVQIGS